MSDFRLQSCPKTYILDQDKTIDPMSTVKKALERLSQCYDISHLRIEPRHDEISGAYSFSSLSDQLQASGKGLTAEQSQASAIMEFLERYSWLHFDYQDYDGYTVSSFDQIKAGPVPTVGLDFFFSNFIDLRERVDLEKAVVDIPMKWLKGVSLHDYSKFYYPLNWYNYIFTSNGLATGNALEEAILQAMCEVIERENIFRLFGDNRIANDIDEQSFNNPLIKQVLTNAKKQGISLVIKDISFDLKVPTILVYGICHNDRFGLTHKGCGYGTHPNPEKACIRALSEYFESYSLLKERQKKAEINWAKLLSKVPRRNFGFLTLYNPDILNQRKKVIKISDLPDWSRKDIKDEIKAILKTLKQHRYEVVYMNKTHPQIGIPVVRIFIPGMRNLVVSEFQDADSIMSEVYHEAGDKANALEYAKRSVKRHSFSMPEVSAAVDPEKAFRSDYRETLLAINGFKKDIYELLDTFGKGLLK